MGFKNTIKRLHRKVEVYDNVFHIWFSPYVDLLPKGVKRFISPPSFLGKIKFLLKVLIKDINRLFLSDNLPKEQSIWLFVSTVNNLKSIEFLKNDVPNAVLVKPQILYKEQVKEIEHRIVYRVKLFYTLKWIFLFPFYVRHSKKKEFLKKNWTYFFYGCGIYEESLKALRRSKPRAIVFSNDHSVEQRALLIAAKELNIKTMYVQHASVSEYFPPLEFSLSLLEGKDALNKYQNIASIEGEVKLVGMPKFDPYLKYRKPIDKVETIGICFNPSDEIKDVKEIADYLEKELSHSVNFIIRPHPGDNRDFSILDQELSNSKNEHVFDFLKKVDAIIAGDSSIHLEAAMLNKYPIYFNFSDTDFDDYYGYVENGLVKKVNNKEMLLDFLTEIKEQPPSVFEKTKFYNEMVGTPAEGKVKKLVTKIIIEQIDNLG